MGRFIRLRSPKKLDDLLKSSPNTRITLILTESLTPELCADIQKILKIREDVDSTSHTMLGKFFKHTFQVRVDDRHKFKRNMIKLRDKYPHIVIDSESVSHRKRILVWFGGSGVIGVVSLVVKMLNLWPF